MIVKTPGVFLAAQNTEFLFQRQRKQRMGLLPDSFDFCLVDAVVDISALTGSISPDQELWIGAMATDGQGPGGLDGSLDDLRLYNSALSANEIGQLANIPAPGSLAVLALGLLGRRRRR